MMSTMNMVPLRQKKIIRVISLSALTVVALATWWGYRQLAHLKQIEAAAHAAQTTCHGKIHHEAYDFAECILALADQEHDAWQRLGVEYFGWVGALGSERLGMRGAKETAYTMMDRFLVTQATLSINDASLCRTVPGDCEVRLARLQQMRTQADPALRLQPQSREQGSGEQH